MCSLEQASADDGLLPLLSLGGQPVQSLVVFTTQLLPKTHQQMLHLLMVRTTAMLQLNQRQPVDGGHSGGMLHVQQTHVHSSCHLLHLLPPPAAGTPPRAALPDVLLSVGAGACAAQHRLL